VKLPPPLCGPALSLVALAVTAVARPASAQEGKSFPVVVRPGDQAWSVGGRGGSECSPTCTIHLTPRSYKVVMGGTDTEVWLDGPSELAYRPPASGLRYLGGGLVLLGVGGGIAMTYLATKACVSSGGTGASPPDCTGSIFSGVSPGVKIGLVAAAAGLFTSAVVGGFLFYLGGESIRVRALPPVSAAIPRLRLDLGPQGGTLGLSTAF
jgi:hypothetical protein